MAFWLVKEEPENYPFEQFQREGRTAWTGVRNYQARNNLRAMERGDRVIFYHSGKLKAAVGVAKVVKTAYADPTAKEGDWSCVDLRCMKALKRPVPLAEVRADEVLGECPLVRHTRLSVMPLSDAEFERFLELTETRLPKS